MELLPVYGKDVFADLPAGASGSSEIVSVKGGDRLSCQAIYDVQSPTAKTFDSGKKALLVDQSVTYTAVTAGVDGNSITITLVDPGTDGVLDIEVTGTDIVVTLAYAAAAITTDADALVAALNLDVAAAALILASGTGNTPLTALAETPLATGADSEVSLVTDIITIPSHGFLGGLKVQGTTTGTLPAPLALATDYFVIVVDSNSIQLATSLANALAGTNVEFSDVGSNGAVNTLTAVALSGGAVQFYASNDGTNWTSLASSTAITVDGSTLLVQPDVAYAYFKAIKSLTAGQVDLKAYVRVMS